MDMKTPVIKNKILIVDDDESVNDFLMKFLQRRGTQRLSQLQPARRPLKS